MSDTKASRLCYEKTMKHLKDLEKRSSVVTDKDKEIIKNIHENVVEKVLKEWLKDSFFKRIEEDFNKHEFIQPNDEIFDNPLLNDLFHDSLLRGMFAVINWVQTHQQEVYDEFFAPSLISDTEPDTSPISVADVDNFFASINMAKYPETATHPHFEIPSEEELSLLEEAAWEDLKQKVKSVFEADGKNIEKDRENRKRKEAGNRNGY